MTMSEALNPVEIVAPEGRRARPELVVLAASAGGIPATRTILAELPATFPVPIVVLQHRSPTSASVLSKILGRWCKLRVKDAEVNEPFARGTVYVAPADAHLVVGPDRRFHFLDGRKVNFVRSSADPLIQSAAHALCGRVVAVILTGGGRNGTGGVRDVRALGGTVIAQDPVTAQHPGMPRAAIATGAVDYILPLEGIAPLLERLTSEAPNDERPAEAAREAL
jgi:two-component system chemotaxis response regulator CheB